MKISWASILTASRNRNFLGNFNKNLNFDSESIAHAHVFVLTVKRQIDDARMKWTRCVCVCACIREGTRCVLTPFSNLRILHLARYSIVCVFQIAAINEQPKHFNKRKFVVVRANSDTEAENQNQNIGSEQYINCRNTNDILRYFNSEKLKKFRQTKNTTVQ